MCFRKFCKVNSATLEAPTFQTLVNHPVTKVKIGLSAVYLLQDTTKFRKSVRVVIPFED